MKVIRHVRHADQVMRIEGTLAVAGVGGGILLWLEAAHFGGYGFAAAAFLGLGGVNSGVKAMRNYNRYQRGAEGEEAALSALQLLPDDYIVVTNYVIPGTRQGDTDLIVLGPFGIFVAEVKAYTGHYACHSDAWFYIRDDGSRQPLRTSVSRQTKRNRKALQHYLVDCEISAPVYGAAVFCQNVRLDLDHPTIPILHHCDLAEYILQLPLMRRPAIAASELKPLFSVKK